MQRVDRDLFRHSPRIVGSMTAPQLAGLAAVGLGALTVLALPSARLPAVLGAAMGMGLLTAAHETLARLPGDLWRFLAVPRRVCFRAPRLPPPLASPGRTCRKERDPRARRRWRPVGRRDPGR